MSIGLHAGSTTVGKSAASSRRVKAGESIQAEIERAAAGDTVTVDPGVYHETVIIDKPLTLTSAAGPGTTIIRADASRFAYRDIPTDDIIVGAINVVRTENVKVEGFTVTDALEGIWLSNSRDTIVQRCVAHGNQSSGFYYWACQEGLVSRCVGYDNAVGAYEGQSWNVSIQDCCFHANRGGRAPHLGGRYGLEFPGIGILCGNRSALGRIEGCTVTANADAGIQINVQVRNKEVRKCLISANRIGLALGERVSEASGCNITGNREFGLSSSLPVDARRNWWGHPGGPAGAGPGQGDRVTEQVEFDPWLKRPADVPNCRLARI